MNLQAQTIWDSLEFRTPAILAAVDRVSEQEFQWLPPNGANPIAWLLWHIAEVEDNWVRDKLLVLPRRYPFEISVKARGDAAWPSKTELVAYFHEVRALTRERLERTSEDDFDREIADEHYGSLTVRALWAGVASSCAWHGGQIILIANRLLPGRGSKSG